MEREKSLLLASVHMHSMTTDRTRSAGRNHWKAHQHPTQYKSIQIQMLKAGASQEWLVSLGGDSTAYTGNLLQHLTTQGKGFPLALGWVFNVPVLQLLVIDSCPPTVLLWEEPSLLWTEKTPLSLYIMYYSPLNIKMALWRTCSTM